MVKKYFGIKYWKGQRLLLLAFLLVHTIASFYYNSQQNITFDEPNYIEYAKRWLHGQPERIKKLDDSKSPVIAICWLPRMVKQVINPNYQLNDYGRQDQKDGRYMMILFSFLAALYVYRWCCELYGANESLLPLLLLLFDPLFLAYSTLITTDLASGAFMVALLFHFWRYLERRTWKHLLLAAFFTGLAVVTKQSALFVLLLLPVMSLLFQWVNKERLNGVRLLTSGILYSLVVVVVVNTAYYFKGTFIPFGDYAFVSQSMQGLQESLSFLHWMPVPFPESFIQSLDMLQRQSEIGGGTTASSYSGVYILGNYKANGGYWYYYVVLLFYKMPIGTMLLLIGASVLMIKNFRLHSFGNRYQFLLLPVVYFFVVLSCFNKFQIGLRHLLIIYPLLFIGVGYVFCQLKTFGLPVKATAYGLIAYSVITMLLYYPDLIPYTNELIADKAKVYRKVFDTSIDYGQSDSAASRFSKQHPAYKLPVAKPTPGKYMVMMGEMLDYNLRDRQVYPWYQQMKPDSLINHVILLYDIKEENLRKAGL